MLNQNSSLCTLSLAKVGLTDATGQVLVSPIAESITLQNLKLDFNQLGSVFIERVCGRMK